MVGHGNEQPAVVDDQENPGEKHEFFDLKGREEIARDILSIAQQADEARLRLTRAEFKSGTAGVVSQAFVRGGVVGEWKFEELMTNRFDNEHFEISEDGELSINPNNPPSPGYNRIFLRARAGDGTGMVMERPYSVWILKDGKSKIAQDLDSTHQPKSIPPLTTPRPHRTH